MISLHYTSHTEAYNTIYTACNIVEAIYSFTYTNPESHTAQRHRQTDGQTDRRTDGQQAAANSRSYCVAVRSAKKI